MLELPVILGSKVTQNGTVLPFENKCPIKVSGNGGDETSLAGTKESPTGYGFSKVGYDILYE